MAATGTWPGSGRGRVPFAAWVSALRPCRHLWLQCAHVNHETVPGEPLDWIMLAATTKPDCRNQNTARAKRLERSTRAVAPSSAVIAESLIYTVDDHSLLTWGSCCQESALRHRDHL